MLDFENFLLIHEEAGAPLRNHSDLCVLLVTGRAKLALGPIHRICAAACALLVSDQFSRLLGCDQTLLDVGDVQTGIDEYFL